MLNAFILQRSFRMLDQALCPCCIHTIQVCAVIDVGCILCICFFMTLQHLPPCELIACTLWRHILCLDLCQDACVCCHFIIIVNRCSVRILYYDMGRLENRFVTNILTLVLYPYYQWICAGNRIIKAVAMLHLIQIDPVLLRWYCIRIVGYPVCFHAGSAVIFDKGNSVVIDSHTCISQGDRCYVPLAVLSRDLRRYLIQKCRRVGLEYL